MFTIKLKNNKSFSCNADTTILNAAKEAGIQLEHSCLSAKCRSCAVKVTEGKGVKLEDDLVLTDEDHKEGVILTCNTKPISDMILDLEDIGEYDLQKPRTLPAKIDEIQMLENDVVKVKLRLPPNSNFKFLPGQYVNILNQGVKRSYSIANTERTDGKLVFYIKKYENGVMSKFWFEKAKENNVLRVEGPLGTFFYRENESENIIFLATGTGIAPVKAILEQLDKNPSLYTSKKVWLIWGGRYAEDIFWQPEENTINFIPVLSRADDTWKGARGYVQDEVLKQKINLENTQVYACGSTNMIASAKELFSQNGMKEHQFYADAFVSSN